MALICIIIMYNYYVLYHNVDNYLAKVHVSSVLGSATLRMHVYVINKLALSIGNFI